MEPITAYGNARRNSNNIFSLSTDQLIQVRKLYLERRYKLCIAVCEKLQSSDVHAIHVIFLVTHEAVCYESLGLAAHKFSSKKIQFLEQAKDQLASALEKIATTFVSYDPGTSRSAEISPSAESYELEEASNLEQSFSDRGINGLRVSNDSKSSTTSNSSYYSLLHKAAKSVVLPRIELQNLEEGTISRSNQLLRTADAIHELEEPLKSTYKHRLSQSLSLGHVVDDDLVPSPLFDREEPIPDFISLTKPIFYPRMRKTAVQTLISRYEGVLPFASTSAAQHLADFNSKPSPQPVTHILSCNLLSSSLDNYHKSLESLRTILRSQLSSIGTRLSEAIDEQAEHKTRKQLNKVNHRLASYWSFNVQASVAAADDEVEDVRIKEKKERIKRLRDCGWEVRKEKYGWKGQEYYTNFRKEIEAEI